MVNNNHIHSVFCKCMTEKHFINRDKCILDMKPENFIDQNISHVPNEFQYTEYIQHQNTNSNTSDWVEKIISLNETQKTIDARLSKINDILKFFEKR